MMNFQQQRVLVIAPHPDDEAFGCGGLISRVKREGGKVYVLYMTVGLTHDFSVAGTSTADERIKEIEQVAKHLQLDGYRLAFPGDQYHLQLDAVPQKKLIHDIERGSDISLEALKPTMVITSSADDYNQDHRAVYQATMTATRPSSPAIKAFQPIFLTFDHPTDAWSVSGSIPAKPFFIQLSKKDVATKIQAIKLYKSQLKHPENPISVKTAEAAAIANGRLSGSMYAEAFGIKRFVIS